MMSSDLFRAFGISRHRLATDGVGVTTLVCGVGCPLSCRYCINPICADPQKGKSFTKEELFERVKCDSLYFEATNGGITFGGGEPLLQAEFIADFIRMINEKGLHWAFDLETSLAVPNEKLALLDGLIREYTVDVKDLNPAIYSAYTGKENVLLLENLRYLAERFPERVTLRLPLIPDYNSDADRDASEAFLKKLGFSKFDRFLYITDVKGYKKSMKTS